MAFLLLPLYTLAPSLYSLSPSDDRPESEKTPTKSGKEENKKNIERDHLLTRMQATGRTLSKLFFAAFPSFPLFSFIWPQRGGEE